MTQPLLLTHKKKPKLLSVEGLAKAYAVRRGLLGRNRALVHALSDVSFELAAGETLGFVGESGSGKSTLGKVVLRLIDPSFGRIVFDGTDITRLDDRGLLPFRRRMQMVFQDPYSSLNPRMLIRDVVAEGIDVFRLYRGKEREDRVCQLLSKVGLDRDLLERFPSELSGGQRQRVAIARALSVSPELLVCDEPTSALDASVQAQILNLLSDLQAETNAAYVFISHDLRVVELLAHRIAVLFMGKIVELASSTSVAERRLHPYTRALFEASPALPRAGAPPRSRRSLPLAVDVEERPSARGCAYFSRCPKRETGKCDHETPELRRVKSDPSHQVACFFPG